MTSDPFSSDYGPLGNRSAYDAQSQAQYAQRLYETNRHMYEYHHFTSKIVGDMPEQLLRCHSCNALVTKRFTYCPFCDGAMRDDVQRINEADSAGNPEEREQDASERSDPNLGEKEHEVHGSRDPDRVAGRPDTGAGTEGETTDSAVSGSSSDPKPDDTA